MARLKHKVMIVIGLCFLIAPFCAQAQTGYPPVLSPADILTSVVHVVATLPVLNGDDNARLLYFLDETGWKTYPYPNDLEKIMDSAPRADGTFLLASEGFIDSGPVKDSGDLWLFDPKSGDISRAPLACGLLKNLAGDGQWVFFRENDSAPFRLCFTETGKLGPILPEKLQPVLCGNVFRGLAHRMADLSPDRKWVVFPDCTFPNFSLYAYEVATGKVTYLGTNDFGDDEWVKVTQWADNRHPIIFSQDSKNDSTRSLFVADVTKVNSLQPIVSHYAPSNVPLAQYQENPSRFVWIPGYYSFVTGSEACQVHEFSLKTFHTAIYGEIPGVCGLGITIPDGTGDRIFRSVEPDMLGDQRDATLIRFNYQRGTSHTLLTAPIQVIESLSPGGSFAEVLLDSSRTVLSDDEYLNWRGSFYETMELKSPRLAVIDVKTGKTLYERTLAVNFGVALSPQLVWLDDNAFVLTSTPDYELSTPSDRLFQIQEGQARESAIQPPQILLSTQPSVGMFATNPYGSATINYTVSTRATNPYGSAAISVFDVSTRQIVPIIRPVDTNKYRLEVKMRDDGLIDILIFDEQRSKNLEQPPFMLRHWLVTRSPG